MPKLVLRKKAEIVLEYLLNKDFLIIGSMEDCDIYIPDKTVSLNHCQIKKEGDKYILYDLKGAYGTFVNGEKILSKELNFEDKIELGNHTLVFRSSDSKIEEKEQRYYLLGISGPFEGKKFELNNGETRIGRGEEYNDIVLPGEIDHSVSRRHSTIVRFENKFTLNDKRSRNRTFVNQYQLKEDDVVPLYLKDEILIGHSIFRFVNEDCLDYSNPIKAGIFWIRFKTKILYVLLGSIFILGISAFYYGFYGLLIVSNTPKIFSVKVSSWDPKINKDRLAYAFSPEYDLLPSPAVGEINRDKRSEVVVYNTSGVYAWDSQNGQLLWKMLLKKNEGALSASPVLADVNEDGCLDVVICSLDSRVYIINGLSGKVIYKSEILGGNINSSPVVADIDDDGLKDVVVASQEGVVYFIYAPVTTGKISSVRVGSDLFSSPTVYQDKKRKFIAIGSSEGKIFFFNGREISDSFFMDTRDAINKLQGVHLPINEISSTPVVADLDGDDNLDIVVHSNQYYL